MKHCEIFHVPYKKSFRWKWRHVSADGKVRESQESYELYFGSAFDNVVNFIKGTPTNIVNPGALQVRR